MKYGKPKRYSNGVQTAGKVASALGGVADIVAINTTDDDIRKTAQYTGSALKGVGATAQNYRGEESGFDISSTRMHTNKGQDRIGEGSGEAIDYSNDDEVVYSNDDDMFNVKTPYSPSTMSDLNTKPYRNGVNKRDKKRYV